MAYVFRERGRGASESSSMNLGVILFKCINQKKDQRLRKEELS